MWGGGAQLPKQRTGSSIRALYRSFVLQMLAWSRLPTRLDSKKTAFKFSIYISAFFPLCPPCIHSCDERSQAFLVFCQSSAPMHYCECKRKIKMGGGLETRLYPLHLSPRVTSWKRTMSQVTSVSSLPGQPWQGPSMATSRSFWTPTSAATQVGVIHHIH